MNKKLKIILAVVILVIILVVVFFLAHGQSAVVSMISSQSSAERGTGSSTNSENGTYYDASSMVANSSGSIQNTGAPTDYGSPDDDIDTYLKAYRSAEQPDPNDFNSTYSDLK